MDVAFGAESGPERRRGEESYLVEMLAPGVNLLSVADGFGSLGTGMPGAPHALHLVRDYLRRTARAGTFAGQTLNAGALQQTVVAALGYANSLLFSRSGSNDDYIAGGIAVVTALVVGRQVFIAHVGDARLYVARRGRIEALTFDDAVTIEEVPSTTSTTLAMPQRRSLLWRSLGTQARLEAGVSQIELFPGDRLLLCTSGVYRRLSTEQLSAALLPAATAAESLAALWSTQHAHGDGGGAAIVAFDPLEPSPQRAQFVSPSRRLRPTMLAALALACGVAVLLLLQSLHRGH